MRILADWSTNCINVRNNFTNIPENAYGNLEKLLVGYNVYTGAPYSVNDEGFMPG